MAGSDPMAIDAQSSADAAHGNVVAWNPQLAITTPTSTAQGAYVQMQDATASNIDEVYQLITQISLMSDGQGLQAVSGTMQVIQRMSSFSQPTVRLRACEAELARVAQQMQDDQAKFGRFEQNTKDLFHRTITKAREALRHQQSQFENAAQEYEDATARAAAQLSSPFPYMTP